MATTTYNIAVINRNKEFKVQAGETMLAGLERTCCDAIDVGCRGGGCGMCKVKVLSGTYQTKRMSSRHVCGQQAAVGFALACRLLPESDLVVESDHFVPAVPNG